MQTDLSDFSQDELEDRIVQTRALILFVTNNQIPAPKFYEALYAEYHLAKNEHSEMFPSDPSDFRETTEQLSNSLYRQFKSDA